MFDFSLHSHSVPVSSNVKPGFVGGGTAFWAAKRLFDIVVSIALIPILLTTGLALLVLNPWLNKCKVIFVQTRMGKDCKPFQARKFRSMTYAANIERGPDDPIEHERITRLGRFLRKSRLDELPQIFNVLKGEMSLIGPRPDYYDHAQVYVKTVRGYRERHNVRPGISGLSQVSLGYIEGTSATQAKVDMDLEYIHQAGFGLDSLLVVKTIKTVVTRAGA